MILSIIVRYGFMIMCQARAYGLFSKGLLCIALARSISAPVVETLPPGEEGILYADIATIDIAKEMIDVVR